MGNQLVIGELSQDDGALLGQNTGLQQLGQHALNPVRVFGHIFQKQQPTRNLRKIRRS